MTPLETRYLECFPAWLRTLSEDARALALVLEREGPQPGQHAAAVALTYLFKSLDLIPDGLEDLGFMDDAFVFRVAAARVPLEVRAADDSGTLARLAADAELIAEFLGTEYSRLELYVENLNSSAARGRSVADLLQDPELRSSFLSDVRSWAEDHGPPPFLRDEKNLVKLRAFLVTRLGAQTVLS